jgi:hypothetical protein
MTAESEAASQLVMTEAEQRALDASCELAAAMRALIPGIGESAVAGHDWAEVASRIHDIQARIFMVAACRLGAPGRGLGEA